MLPFQIFAQPSHTPSVAGTALANGVSDSGETAEPSAARWTLTTGGAQIDSDVVSYDDGFVRVVFPLPGSGDRAYDSDPIDQPVGGGSQADVTPDFSNYGCPCGISVKWSGFYQNANYGGTVGGADNDLAGEFYIHANGECQRS